MRRTWGFALLGLLMSGVVSNALADPAGFAVSLNNATAGAGGKLTLSADGTYTHPTTHQVDATDIVLFQNGKEVKGAGPLIDTISKKALTWSVADGPVSAAGTYDVKARFTFSKVKAQPGDPTFEVYSNEIKGVKIGP